MRTNELSGAALDWAVAKCEGTLHDDGSVPDYFQPSIDWEQGGAIIECERLSLTPRDGYWEAYYHDNLFKDDGSDYFQKGTTPLIAAMRCYVASKLGDEVEIPEELK
jgi:hypothetical protein